MNELESKGSSAGMGTRLSALARGVSAKMPGGEFLYGQLQDAERSALARLKARLDELEPQTALSNPSNGAAAASVSANLRDRYAQLVHASMNQTPDSALEMFFGKLLDELVPDEARVLNAAYGDDGIAIVHLDLSRRRGGTTRELAYLSRAGNECGVMRQELTPQYLMHLVGMGLMHSGPADPDATNKYEMIENESTVRKLVEKLANERQGKTQLVRRTLSLTPLGQDFMQACNGPA